MAAVPPIRLTLPLPFSCHGPAVLLTPAPSFEASTGQGRLLFKATAGSCRPSRPNIAQAVQSRRRALHTALCGMCVAVLSRSISCPDVSVHPVKAKEGDPSRLRRCWFGELLPRFWIRALRAFLCIFPLLNMESR